MNLNTIIFDLGGVLIDWNPVYVYRKIFADEAEMRYFLTEICSSEWNEQQDAGRPMAEATEMLVREHPHYEAEIRAFYGRWEEMLAGPLDQTVEILRKLHEEQRYRLYALTNWSHETFPVALSRFDFLHLFEGILVSGQEKMKKPDPEIFKLLAQRYDIHPPNALFIDDNLRNVAAAANLGFQTIHFESPQALELRFREMGIAL